MTHCSESAAYLHKSFIHQTDGNIERDRQSKKQQTHNENTTYEQFLQVQQIGFVTF